MEPVTIIAPRTEDFRAQLAQIEADGQQLAIRSDDDYAAAGAYLRRIAAYIDEVESRFGDVVSTAHRLHKMLCDVRRSFTEPAAARKALVSQAMVTYEAQKRKALEAERARREAEERQREEERRLQDAIQREAEAKALAAAGQAEDAAIARMEARELVEMPVVPLPAPPIEVPKATGISIPKKVAAFCDDKVALIKWVAANPMYANLLEVDVAALTALARSLGERFNVPGCRRELVASVSVRR